MKFTTRDLVFVGLLAALCAVSPMIKVPGPNGAMVHIGSGVSYLAAIIFGGYYGALAGAIGFGLYDLLISAFPVYAPFSIVIKAVTGLLLGYMTVGLLPPTKETPYVSISRMLVSTLVISLVSAVGWVIAWYCVIGSFATAISYLPFTFLSSGLGIIMTLLIGPKLQKLVRKMWLH